MVCEARRLVGMAVLTGLFACGEAPSSPEDPTPPPGFAAVVSDPFTLRPANTAAAASRPAFSGAMIDGIAFVSVAPGTVPEAERATVVNTRTGQQIAPSVVDGGFDPVGIGAEAGDTVVTTLSSESGVVAYAKSVVPARRRPRVVRTSPARGRTDVAINANITIVFSEPIDPATLIPTSVVLVRGADTVAAVARLLVGTGVTVELAPDAPLAPGTGYTLVIASSIRDRSGDPIELEAPTEFSTAAEPSAPLPSAPDPSAPEPAAPEPTAPLPGSQIPEGARLEFTTQPSDATAFTSLAPSITVTMRDAEGATVTGFSGPVTILLGVDPSSPRWGAQWEVNAVGGVAHFAELSVPDPGDYTLIASAGPTLSATSDPFTVAESPWVALRPPSGPANRAFAAGAVLDGKIYYLGGTEDKEYFLGAVADVDAYDPATNTWSSRAPLPEPRARAGAGVVDGILYVLGGLDEAGTMQASVYAYDPAADSWTVRAPLPQSLTHPGIGAVNGKLFAVGGIGDGSGPVALVSVYDPVTNAWTAGQPMPTARGGPGVAVVGSTLYAVGGGYGFGFVDNVEAYDAVTDSWSIRRSMPAARGFMGVAAGNGLVYAIGGFVDEPYYHWVGLAEVYDPLEDSWSVIPSIPSDGHNQTIAVTIGGIVYALGQGDALVRLGP